MIFCRLTPAAAAVVMMSRLLPCLVLLAVIGVATAEAEVPTAQAAWHAAFELYRQRVIV